MIYKYCPPTRFTVENLAHHSVYCRPPCEFNDPFEFWSTVHNGLPTFNDDDDRFRAAVAAWGFPGTKLKDLPLDHDTFLEYFGSLCDSAPDLHSIYDHARVSCFSSDPRNLLMWSHYADGLRGCCLGFDCDHFAVTSETLFITDVQYVRSPPVIDTLVYAVTEDLFLYAIDHGYEEYEGESFRKQLNDIMARALASKPLEWQYEKERRLIIHTREDGLLPIQHSYPPQSLQTVILGERMSDEFKGLLRSVLQSMPHVSLQQAVRSTGTFEIRLENTAI